MAKTPVTFTLNGAEPAGFVDGGAPPLGVLGRGVGALAPEGGVHQGPCGSLYALVWRGR